jgi:hypothetical protein
LFLETSKVNSTTVTYLITQKLKHIKAKENKKKVKDIDATNGIYKPNINVQVRLTFLPLLFSSLFPLAPQSSLFPTLAP